MADNLPEPESRKEQYLAKAAGMTVEDLPTPASREELYLNAIAEGGGGGGTSDFDQLSNRPKYNGTAMTGETNIPASPTVVQTVGASETDVMSQDATTKMVYSDPATRGNIAIGNDVTVSTSTNYHCISIGQSSGAAGFGSVSLGYNASTKRNGDIAIGNDAKTSPTNNIGDVISIGAGAGDANFSNTDYSISIGNNCAARCQNSVVIGRGAYAQRQALNSVAIGYGANTTVKGQFDIGTSGSNGYSNSVYRLLTGVYDPQNDHDAATKGYVDTKLGGMTLVPISQTDYDNLGTKDPNTLYVITGA